jgi:hypothetical protein
MDKCKHSKPSGFFSRVQCSKSAKKDGFCGIHHPDARAKRDERYNLKYAEKRNKWDEEAKIAKYNREAAHVFRELGIETPSVQALKDWAKVNALLESVK